MKRKITLLLLAASSMFKMQSQVMLSENFTSPFPIATNGWVVVDNTSPASGQSWTQGNGTGGNGQIPAYNGNTNDFYMADFTAVSGTVNPGVISAFLITPTLTIYNGAQLQFATRTLSQSPTATYPDRLQVLMSQTGATTIPTGTNSVGSFTDLMLDINPLLSTTNASAVTNGSVNGYPFSWTVYNLTVSNVTGTVTGRFAFRYFVTNAGGSASATNSRLVGVDAVKYTLPCGPTIQSFTTCAGASTTLTAMGGLPSTTYLWNTTSTASSIVVSPNATTVYTLAPGNGTIVCGNAITATVTVGSQLSVSVSASSSTICSGAAVLLAATSPATSYAWTTGSITNVIAQTQTVIVTPSVTTTYSVGALNGSCAGTNSITITVNASPSLSVSLSPACVGGSLTVSASGANTYTFLGQSVNPVSLGLAAIGATTTGGNGYTFVLAGSNANGCAVSGSVAFTVNPNPTVSVSSSTAVACTNNTITITASGASTYSYSGAATSTTNPLSYATGSVAGTKTFTIIGVDATSGCSATKIFTQSVVVCSTGTTSTVGIVSINGYEETSIYPNPFVNEINVTVLDGTVLVYNAIGQAVIRATVHSSEIINTTDLPKGVYFVKAYNENGEMVKTVKLIKN